jgi:glucokinase
MRAAISIDVGGTKTLAGLVAEDGTVLVQCLRPTVRERYLQTIEEAAADLVDYAHRHAVTPVGIGVGTTGLVDHRQGRLVRSMNMGLENVAIGEHLRNRFGLDVFVDNDLHAATLGEMMFGVGRTYPDFVVFNAGTGIAAGMVFGGRLVRGASNVSGELCHTSVEQHHRGCTCGLPGCLESIVLELRNGGTAPEVRLPRVPDPPAPAYGYLALGVIHLVNLLNPPAVVLMGGMLTHDPAAVAWLHEAVRLHALPDAVRGLESFALSELPTGLVGAAALVYEGLGK